MVNFRKDLIMNSLKGLIVNVLNIDCGKAKTGKEWVRIQGFYSLPDKKKESVLCGEYGIIEIFDALTEEYEEVCGNAKKVESIEFKGYYENFVFKPVSIEKINYKKEK